MQSYEIKKPLSRGYKRLTQIETVKLLINRKITIPVLATLTHSAIPNDLIAQCNLVVSILGFRRIQVPDIQQNKFSICVYRSMPLDIAVFLLYLCNIKPIKNI